MFNGMTDLIYDSNNMKAKLDNIKELIKKFDKIPYPSIIHHNKFIDDLKSLVEDKI